MSSSSLKQTYLLMSPPLGRVERAAFPLPLPPPYRLQATVLSGGALGFIAAALCTITIIDTILVSFIAPK